MVNSRANRLFIILSLLFLTAGGTDDLDPAMLESWKASWEKEAEDMIQHFIDGIDEIISSLEAENREPATRELRAIMQSAIGWKSLREVIVAKMKAHCSADLLDRIAPYFSGEADFSEAEQTLVNEYSVCYRDAMYHINATAAFKIAAEGEKMEAALHRYGMPQ